MFQIYHQATREDLELWLEAKKRERDLMLNARGLAAEYHMDLQINDAEFQGDGKKVTMFYKADRHLLPPCFNISFTPLNLTWWVVQMLQPVQG